MCPSFAPSAVRASSLAELARSIQFTSPPFFPRQTGIRTEQRKETYVLFREEELQPAERARGRGEARRGRGEGSGGGEERGIPLGKAHRGRTSLVLKASRVL